ncbi:hypothetical protein B0T13DRAFT_9428 [Neurospora crassa]|nr:hypothetical protein B0T13DRAFT_9428 [Neurospora crassa]
MPPGKKTKKPKQQTLEASLGQPRIKPPTVKKISTRSSSYSTSTKGKEPLDSARSPATTAMAPARQRQRQREDISPDRQLPASSAVFIPKISTAEAKKRTIVIDDDSDSTSEAEDHGGAAFEYDDLPVFSSQAVVTVTHNPRAATSAAAAGSRDQKEVVVLDEEDEDDDMPLPTQRTRGVKRQMAAVSDEDEDEDEGKREGKVKEKAGVNDEGEEEDSDSDRVLSSAVRKRATRRGGEKESSPTKKRRLIRRGNPSSASSAKEEENSDDYEPRRLGKGRLKVATGTGSSSAATSSTESRPARAKRRVKKPMTEKERARELLRRKRAGEPIDDLENVEGDEDSEVELPKRGYYDTDSDNPALSEFEDEETDKEEIVKEEEREKKKGKGKTETKDNEKTRKRDKKGKKRREISPDSEDTEDSDEKPNAGDSYEYEDEEMQDFISEDDSDAPIGAPDEIGIPLEFTRHAHKPLKEHFRDVVEWLVHYKIHPKFPEKTAGLYRLGWRKLDDEVRGLAQSKFASSAWKTDFYMALRARPYYTSGETQEQSIFLSNCAACGRSGHPAKFEIAFSGSPYYKDFSHPRFLEAVPNNNPSPSPDDEDGDPDENDADGNTIPAASRHWKIGSVCHSNAETAHNLLHWQYALLDWVDTRLSEDGHLAAAAAISKKRESESKEKRKKRTTKKKYKLVAKIVSEWEANGTVKALFREFKNMLEAARNKSTAGPRVQKR